MEIKATLPKGYMGRHLVPSLLKVKGGYQLQGTDANNRVYTEFTIDDQPLGIIPRKGEAAKILKACGDRVWATSDYIPTVYVAPTEKGSYTLKNAA